MTLPPFAVARLTRMTYVRFLLDHDHGTARALNAGPQEAVHSSANGEWTLAAIEPFADVQMLGDLPGLRLRLMGSPFNTLVVYDILDHDADPDPKAMKEPYAEDARNEGEQVPQTGGCGPRHAGHDPEGAADERRRRGGRPGVEVVYGVR